MKQLLITIAALVLVGCGPSLYEAAEEGKINEVKRLLADGADVNAKGGNNDIACFEYTPMHIAARGGHKEIAKLLIEKGADVNSKNVLEWTPLQCGLVTRKSPNC